MHVNHFLIPMLAFTAGCAASTYPLNPQLAAEVGLAIESPSINKPVDKGPAATTFLQKGNCSWYGPGFHGRRTSSGEVFNKYALTAAHPTLPFGSRVEVRDLRSGKKVRVRINDRGPFAHKRILDLSYAAAASLDIVHKGTASVELRLVDIDEKELPDKAWALQVASFPNKIEADRFLEGLSAGQRTAGLYYVKGPDDEFRDYRVRFGPFPCEASAKTAANKLRSVGLKPSVTREVTRNEKKGGPIVR